MWMLAIGDAVWVAIITFASGVVMAVLGGVGWLCVRLWDAGKGLIEWAKGAVQEHMEKVDRIAEAQEQTVHRLETVETTVKDGLGEVRSAVDHLTEKYEKHDELIEDLRSQRRVPK